MVYINVTHRVLKIPKITILSTNRVPSIQKRKINSPRLNNPQLQMVYKMNIAGDLPMNKVHTYVNQLLSSLHLLMGYETHN